MFDARTQELKIAQRFNAGFHERRESSPGRDERNIRLGLVHYDALEKRSLE